MPKADIRRLYQKSRCLVVDDHSAGLSLLQNPREGMGDRLPYRIEDSESKGGDVTANPKLMSSDRSLMQIGSPDEPNGDDN